MDLGHQPVLLWLTLAAVVVSATTAVLFAMRTGQTQQGQAHHWWRLGSALSLAAGIWSMHFIGMVASQSPFSVAFDPVGTALSFLPAIAAGIGLLAIAQSGRLAWYWGAIATATTVIALVAMHYAAIAGTDFAPERLPSGATAAAPGQSLMGLVGEHAWLALLIFILLLTVNLVGMRVSVFNHRLEHAHRTRTEDLETANRHLGSKARQLSQELAREKTIFEAAVDATQDCIWSWQPDTQELFLSGHLHGLLGTNPHYSMATIAELEVRLHREDRPLFRQAFRTAIESPSGQLFHKARLRQADGGWRWVLFRARMVQPRPKAAAMLVGAISDIQTQHHAEEEARQLAAQQREIALLRSRIVRMLSHELRTPLSVVTTCTDLIEAFAIPKSAEQRGRLDHYFENIRDALQKMESILHDALQLNRLESGERVACFNWVRPLTVLDEAIRWACDSQRQARSRVIVRDQGFQGEIQSDARLLEIVLRNLLTNALKYGRDAPITVDVRAEEYRLIFEVTDQGLGVPEAQQSQLFKAFFRGSNVGPVAGTGLGLSIARRAAEACGGELSLVTSSSQGSRFRLVLHASPRITIEEPGP